MIGQVTRGLGNFDIVDAGAGHDGLGRLAAGNAAARGDPDILVVGAGNPDLRVERKHKGQQQQHEDDRRGDQGEG